MLCAPVFVFTSGGLALLGHPHCGLSIWVSLLAILRAYAKLFHEKMDKTRKYLKSAIFLWYENGRQWLLSAILRRFFKRLTGPYKILPRSSTWAVQYIVCCELLFVNFIRLPFIQIWLHQIQQPLHITTESWRAQDISKPSAVHPRGLVQQMATYCFHRSRYVAVDDTSLWIRHCYI